MQKKKKREDNNCYALTSVWLAFKPLLEFACTWRPRHNRCLVLLSGSKENICASILRSQAQIPSLISALFESFGVEKCIQNNNIRYCSHVCPLGFGPWIGVSTASLRSPYFRENDVGFWMDGWMNMHTISFLLKWMDLYMFTRRPCCVLLFSVCFTLTVRYLIARMLANE